MPYYSDLREHLQALDEHGLLVHVKKEIIKETELMPLARLQFRGLPEKERKGFIFENVWDIKKRKYDARVAVGIYAASREMYALGMRCSPDQIQEKWNRARSSPIEPQVVNSGPVHEEIHMGEELTKEMGGLEALPAPVELPGLSGQIRTTSCFSTKDPETGIRNCGIYSGHIFGQTKILWEIARTNHGFIHWLKAREQGKPLQAAIIIGSTPNLIYSSAAKIPFGTDEFAVAGGIAEQPMRLVKCKTVDLEVPATAEIVVEGEISTKEMEPGNAYGEYTGYMAIDVKHRPLFHVTAITHRRNPIFDMIVSQMPPSESSKMRQIAFEAVYARFLRVDCNIPGVIDVAMNEMGQDRYCVIRMKKSHPAQVWQALNAIAGYDPRAGKIYIAVDEDIDPRDPDSVIWALSWRMQPQRDTRITHGKAPGLDPSGAPMDAPRQEKEYPGHVGSSAILIDATTKWPYPPVALPKKEYMDRAMEIWTELGLPNLNLRKPWHGYTLGYWPEMYEHDADLVTKGDHHEINKRLEKSRVQIGHDVDISRY